jgi:tRNA threonylcarbamoyladenosine biosynthesis protein TsaE
MSSQSRDSESTPRPRGTVMRLDRLEGERARLLLSSDSPDCTMTRGALVGALVPEGTVLSLEGGLGVGKTVFVKGLCSGLGVRDEVLSPSFVLAEEYRGLVPVFHFDLYRLERAREVAGIGLLEAADGRAVVIVEWGDRLPPGMLDIDVRIIMRITAPECREITIDAPRGLLAAIEEGKR